MRGLANLDSSAPQKFEVVTALAHVHHDLEAEAVEDGGDHDVYGEVTLAEHRLEDEVD